MDYNLLGLKVGCATFVKISIDVIQKITRCTFNFLTPIKWDRFCKLFTLTARCKLISKHHHLCLSSCAPNSAKAQTHLFSILQVLVKQYVFLNNKKVHTIIHDIFFLLIYDLFIIYNLWVSCSLDAETLSHGLFLCLGAHVNILTRLKLDFHCRRCFGHPCRSTA